MNHDLSQPEEHGELYTEKWEGVRPWGGVRPDEAMELMEEGEEMSGRERAWIQEDLLVYLFADGYAERWEDVALRTLAVMRRYCPSMLMDRKFGELEGLKHRSGLQAKFTMENFDKMTACDEREELLTGLLGYLFPPGKKWLKRGTMRVYLLARTFQPLLLRSHGSEPGYERLEEIFLGRRLNTTKERDRARSRWSARAQKLIRYPVEANGGRIALQFGKSATACKHYAEAAQGNSNRKGKMKTSED